jgi:tRNA(Met) cytidine acetyltransferase
MNEALLLSWINSVYRVNSQTGLRAAIVLSGDAKFCNKVVQVFIDALSAPSVIWLSSASEKGLLTKKATSLLGQEYDALVFDAVEQFDIDAFGVSAGTIKAGGTLFLLIPGEENPRSYFHQSRFFNRAWRDMHAQKNIYLLRQNYALPEVQNNSTIIERAEKMTPPYRTIEQQQVVGAILNQVMEKHKLVIVLTSDRGRGKSSALGIAAGRLLQQSGIKIIVTAPRKNNCEAVFYQAKKTSSAIQSVAGKLVCQHATMEFIAPDAVLEQQPSAELLLVDEASAIPLPMLEKMLGIFPKIVFASTIHGYEGTGRGFALKFNKILDINTPYWRKYQLDTPIRWLNNDPVEKWLDSMLCLHAELECVDGLADINLQECNVECVRRDDLLTDEAKLTSLFALLVSAHYRTQPSDLVYMLDSDSIRIYTLACNNKILAVALISEEGGFDGELCTQVYRGRRRPKGHLLAQTLSFHLGIEFAATLKYARLMRIAVHPELHSQGLGSHLLQQVINRERILGMDAIGSSFGATTELMRFWERLNFSIVRMGFSKDHASGTHSAVMLKALNSAGEAVFNASRIKFCAYIKNWLSEPLAAVSPDMQQYLESHAMDNGAELSDYEWQDIQSFINSHRGYAACMPPLRKLVAVYEPVLAEIDDRYKIIIYTKIKHMHSWPDTVRALSLPGKAKAIELLKEAVGALLKNIKPA